MTETKADGPSARGSGRLSNFSMAGKDTSTRAPLPASNSRSIAGSRCRVWGPKTRSTKGARARRASPS